MQNLTRWSLPWWRYHGRLRRLFTGGVEMTDSVDMCHFTLLRGLLESVSLILVGACALHMGNICYMFSHWVHDKDKTKNLHKVLLLYTLLHNSYISFYIHKRKLCTEPINTTPHIFTVDVNFSFPCENCAGFKWPVSCSTNSLLHFITVTRQLICEPLAQSLSRETDTNFFYSTEQSECPAYFKPQTQGLLLDSQRWKINENI